MLTITLEVPGEADVAELRQKPGYRVVNVTPALPEPKKTRVRRNWAGLLSSETAAAMRHEIEEMRNEWDRPI